MKYLAVLEYGPENYSAHIPDVPGCIATGKTLELVMQSISEALALHLEDGSAPPVQTFDAELLELADRDSVAWIEPAPMNPVSLELERILKVKRFSQTEIAARMGIKRQSLHRMLSPFYWNHETETLRKFAAAVGMELQISLREPVAA